MMFNFFILLNICTLFRNVMGSVSKYVQMPFHNSYNKPVGLADTGSPKACLRTVPAPYVDLNPIAKILSENPYFRLKIPNCRRNTLYQAST